MLLILFLLHIISQFKKITYEIFWIVKLLQLIQKTQSSFPSIFLRQLESCNLNNTGTKIDSVVVTYIQTFVFELYR